MHRFRISARVFSLAGIMAVIIASLVIGPIAFAEDLRSNILPKRSISPVTASNNDNVVGEIIDSYGFRSLTYIINTTTIADNDATFTPEIEVCALDNCDDAVAATGSYIGTVAGATFTIADNNSVFSLGYSGTKRYSRLTIVPANNTGAATFSAIGILGHPKYSPAQ